MSWRLLFFFVPFFVSLYCSPQACLVFCFSLSIVRLFLALEEPKTKQRIQYNVILLLTVMNCAESAAEWSSVSHSSLWSSKLSKTQHPTLSDQYFVVETFKSISPRQDKSHTQAEADESYLQVDWLHLHLTRHWVTFNGFPPTCGSPLCPTTLVTTLFHETTNTD